MQRDWEGYYLDGKSALRRRATVRIMQSGLQIAMDGGEALWWPYSEVRQTQGFYDGEQVRLERGGDIAETLLIEGPAFLSHLRHATPELGWRFHDPTWRGMRLNFTLAAAVAVVGITLALYLWGIPGLASLVAPRIPVAWEEKLGLSIVEHLAPPRARCTDPTRIRRLDEIHARLTAPLSNPPYAFRVLVVNTPAVNALAAPGGYVVIFRGLLEQTQTPEELAGVMAHELQHILRRHTTKALLQHASMGLLLAALTGDASGLMTYGLEGARTLGRLRYSRQHEEEADAEGIRMLLAAGIDPQGMAAFFARLQQREEKSLSVPPYFSTHPPTAERVRRLQVLAGEARTPAPRLLPNYAWRDIVNICHGPGASR